MTLTEVSLPMWGTKRSLVHSLPWQDLVILSLRGVILVMVSEEVE